MKAVVQRVTSASVAVDGEAVSAIGKGLCVLVGLSLSDGPKDLEWLARKLAHLRLFEGPQEKKWDKSAKDLGLEILCVSQFTLQGILKGNKPDFHAAMGPDAAPEAYRDFLERLRGFHSPDLVKDGRFGATMQVSLVNDGPVTINLDSAKFTGAASQSSLLS